MEVLGMPTCTVLTCNFKYLTPTEFLSASDRAAEATAGDGDPHSPCVGAFVSGVESVPHDPDAEGGASAMRPTLRFLHAPSGLGRRDIPNWAKRTREDMIQEGMTSVFYSHYCLERHALAQVERDEGWFAEHALPNLEAAWAKLQAMQREKAMAGTTTA